MVQCAGLFLAGEFKMTPEVKGWVKKCDLRVAADAGAWYLKRSNLHPHVIIGDFDSLPKKHHRHFPKSEFYAYSPIKDQSDAELALRFILTKKPREIVVFGALGKKIDYMFSNFSLLAFISKNVQA
ncbi:MAG: thiamine diphosphokinase, partial [Deltaproteobacteria bacterium]|nr:thiamine diphosphokinase [Deltaproteobacteria bacterium]